MWDSEPEDDLPDELNHSGRVQLFYGFGLDLLGELVHCYQQVREATRPGPKGADHVESPDSEWPSEGDSLQGVRRLVQLVRVELAPDELIHYVSGSHIGSGPIESGSEGFGDQGPRGRMMLTCSRVILLQ